MPKLDMEKYTSASESTSSEFVPFVPDNYMCRIQAVRTEWTDSRGTQWTSEQKQYVKLILDIDEGDFAGRFSEDYWEGEERDWGHTLYMSWSDRAYGILKHTFVALNEANPGFDAEAAFSADRWDLFIGKRIRVSWQGEEYQYNGETRCRVKPDKAIIASENPKAKVKLPDGSKEDYADWKERVLYANQRNQRSASTPYSTDDIPFS